MQPELLEAYGFIFGADLAGSPIQGPACGDQEQAEGLVPGIHPTGSPDKSVCAQGVGAGVEQPGAVALMLGRRIDDERIDRAVPTLISIVILTRHRAGEPDDSLPVGRNEYPECRFGRSLNRATPSVDHVGQ